MMPLLRIAPPPPRVVPPVMLELVIVRFRCGHSIALPPSPLMFVPVVVLSVNWQFETAQDSAGCPVPCIINASRAVRGVLVKDNIAQCRPAAVGNRSAVIAVTAGQRHAADRNRIAGGNGENAGLHYFR